MTCSSAGICTPAHLVQGSADCTEKAEGNEGWLEVDKSEALKETGSASNEGEEQELDQQVDLDDA